MKQNNFLFLDIVLPLFLLLIFVSNFLGLLYITKGNIILSLLISMIMVVCYFFVLKVLKNNKEMMSKNKYLDRNIILWVLFIVLSFGTFALTTHFLNVEFNSKAKIQKDAQEKLAAVDIALTEYKQRANQDLQNYEGELKNKLQAYKRNPDLKVKEELLGKPFYLSPTAIQYSNNINIDQVADAAVSPLANVTKKNINDLNKTLSQGNKEYSQVFEDWKRIQLMSSYKDLNSYVESSILKINTNIKKLPFQNQPMAIPSVDPILPINQPIKLYKKFKPNLLMSSALVLFIHGFILIPFFTEKIRKPGNSYTDDNVREI